ncbi:MAG: L,D-transpeptidase family protein [Coriobacteriia bacterium]|nr:L,D-transpeptidase family protein [Coriobacteriia bacterium]
MPAHMAHMEQRPVPQPQSHRALRIAGITAGVVLALLVIAYAAGCIFFMGRLWPNTHVDNIDFSLKSRAEALDELATMSSDLTMRVSGQNVDFTLTSANAGLSFDTQAAVEQMISHVSPWQWPVQIGLMHDESDVVSTSFNRDLIQAAVEAAIAPYNATASDPVDASVAYDPTSMSYVVLPGALGTKLDPVAVTDAIVAALSNESESATLTSDVLVRQNITADDPTLQQSAATANSYLGASSNLTVNGTVVATINGNLVKDWLVFNPDGTVALDDARLVEWVNALEAQIDDVGGTHTYTRPDGKVITVSGGTYGWITDGAAIEQLVRDTITNAVVGDQELPFKQTAAVYNPGGQVWGARYVDVDISEQYARFYDYDGSLIWETPVITGATFDDRETPTGVYTLNNKALNQTLIGKADPVTGEPIYRTPVTYWMPFIGNAVGLHDASWQSSFGGTLYTTEAGSHGCINLPPDKAAEIWDLIQIGDVVITHY